MNTDCLSTYCPPRSLLYIYSGTLNNPEITLRFFFFFISSQAISSGQNVLLFLDSLLSLHYPLSEAYLYLQPQIRLSSTCPQAKRALSTANSFLNNYTYHYWFCNFLGLSLYLLACKNNIMTAMNVLEFSWKLR